MSRFFWSTASERKRCASLSRQAHQLLAFQVTYNENKGVELQNDDIAMAAAADPEQHNNMLDDDDDDSELDDSLSLSSFDTDITMESGDSMLSSSSSETFSTGSGSRPSSLSSDDNFDLLLNAAVTQSVFLWQEAKQKIDQPIEVPGVQWERRLVVADITEAEAVLHFHFRKSDLQELINQLWDRVNGYLNGTHDKVIVANRYTVPYETGMLLVLFRLAHTTRIRPEMEMFFGMRRRHIACALDTFTEALCALALTYLSNPLLLARFFPSYGDSIHRKCGLLDHIWGFIDGTIRPTCRPSHFQKSNYSGHKRFHGIKFQSVMTPDGFFGHFFGPTNGNRHDSFMLGESGILPALANYMAALEHPYSLYGDPAYPQTALLFGGFRNPPEGSEMAAFNTALSKVRESVEWGFSCINRTWPFLTQKSAMKLFKIPVARYYILGAFLCNLRNCFYSNQVAIYFNLKPVLIAEYLSLIDNAE